MAVLSTEQLFTMVTPERKKGAIILRGTGDPVYFLFLPSFRCAFPQSLYKQAKEQLGVFIQFWSIFNWKVYCWPGARPGWGGRWHLWPAWRCTGEPPSPRLQVCWKLFWSEPIRSAKRRGTQVLICCRSLRSFTSFHTLVPPKRSVSVAEEPLGCLAKSVQWQISAAREATQHNTLIPKQRKA